MKSVSVLPSRKQLERLRDISRTRPLSLGSLGAGVQSSTLLLMSALGLAPREVPRYDAVIFADTQFEPQAVYTHLAVLEEIARSADIPLIKVTAGSIRHDALKPSGHYAAMPLHILGEDGRRGMIKRQCTEEYKVKPIKRVVRAALGAPIDGDGSVGRVPAGRYAYQDIGFSADEMRRVKDDEAPGPHSELIYPLIQLKMTREDCVNLLSEYGMENTPKSACVACPFSGNARWRAMRDTQPDDWAAAIEFDEKIRNGHPAAGTPLRGQAFVHRSRVPLAEANIDQVTPREWRDRQSAISIADYEEDPPGCSPYGCRRTEIPKEAAIEAGA
ncbi:hypothetical protein [Planomonospora parontospora]|uniref:hypothetical protein n=1 Tax=Planomonospora parontospora TaxID=58119 RepID=UPI001940FF79|nr:hypothetical protein [Planomonospora parontospora]